MLSFNLFENQSLKNLASLVHYLDVGGIPTPEAAGIEKILQGMRRRNLTDNQFFQESCKLFDFLYED